MAYYLVRAKPREDLLKDLRQRIDSGEIRQMHPFGTAMDFSLRQARLEDTRAKLQIIPTDQFPERKHEMTSRLPPDHVATG